MGHRERARNAALMYPARVDTEPSKLFRDESPRDPQYSQRPSKLVPPHPQSVLDPHERRAGVLVSQDDVDEAVKKKAKAHLEAKAAHERAQKVKRTAIEILHFSCKLLERSCLGMSATAADDIGAYGTAGRTIDIRDVAFGIGTRLWRAAGQSYDVERRRVKSQR